MCGDVITCYSKPSEACTATLLPHPLSTSHSIRASLPQAHPPQPRSPSPGPSLVFSLPPPRFCLSSPSPPLQPGQDPSSFELPTKGDRGVGQRIFKVAVTCPCEETPTSPTTSNVPFQLPSYVQLTGVRLPLILVQPAPQFIPSVFPLPNGTAVLEHKPPIPSSSQSLAAALCPRELATLSSPCKLTQLTGFHLLISLDIRPPVSFMLLKGRSSSFPG